MELLDWLTPDTIDKAGWVIILAFIWLVLKQFSPFAKTLLETAKFYNNQNVELHERVDKQDAIIAELDECRAQDTATIIKLESKVRSLEEQNSSLLSQVNTLLSQVKTLQSANRGLKKQVAELEEKYDLEVDKNHKVTKENRELKELMRIPAVKRILEEMGNDK
jgi:chromosome segregation ATPase